MTEMIKGEADGGEPEQPEQEPIQGRRRTWILLGVIVLIALCIALPVELVKKRDNENDNTAPSSTASYKQFVSSNSTFPVQLALFNGDIVNGYADEEELKDDLRNAARFLLNNVIQRNIDIASGNGHSGSGHSGSSDGSQGEQGPDEGSEFGTNNQEKGVEEGDAIVSDGVNGKRITCLSTNGQTIDDEYLTPILLTLSLRRLSSKNCCLGRHHW
jgi:hypothetical protein